MQLERIADDTGLNDFDGAAQAVLGAALIAHLRGEPLLVGQLAHEAGLMDGLGQRLLAEAMLAHLHCTDGGDAVSVVRGGDGDGVDLAAHLFVELPEVLVFLGIRELLGLTIERILIDIAERDDGAATGCGIVGVTVTLTADADTGDVDAVIGTQDISDKREGKCRRGGETAVLEKLTTRY